MSTTDRQPSSIFARWNPRKARQVVSPSVPSQIQYARAVSRRSKLTLSGLIYIVLTLFLAVGAINSQNNLLFWLFGVAIAAIIVSGIFSGSVLMRIELFAHRAVGSHAGEPVRLRYSLINHSRFYPLIAAMISEVQTDSQESKQLTPAALAHLGSKQQGMSTGMLTPDHRGQYTLNRVCVSTRFPFGLMQKSLYFDCPRSFVVLPHRLELKPNLIRVAHGQGEAIHKRTNTSSSMGEYWGLREYTPGDPKRSISWKHSARRNKLVVVEHAQPIASKVWIWINARSQDEHNDAVLFERQIALAASIATDSSRRSIPVGIWAPSYHISIHPAIGAAHLANCLHRLAMIDIDQTPTTPDTSPRVAHADSIVMVSRSAHDHQPGRPRRMTAFNVEHISSVMLDPSSLPSALGEAK